MILSEKYKVVEDAANISLYELVTKDVLDENKNPTGETKVVEKHLGYYSTSPLGRGQAYTRMINSEIASLEVQSLQEILDAVKRCEQQVVEFWEVQK